MLRGDLGGELGTFVLHELERGSGRTTGFDVIVEKLRGVETVWYNVGFGVTFSKGLSFCFRSSFVSVASKSRLSHNMDTDSGRVLGIRSAGVVGIAVSRRGVAATPGETAVGSKVRVASFLRAASAP